MRKIHQSVPDVPQIIADRAIDIIERQLVASGVRRAEELSEENKAHLMRELQRFFESELVKIETSDGKTVYASDVPKESGVLNSIRRWINKLIQPTEINIRNDE